MFDFCYVLMYKSHKSFLRSSYKHVSFLLRFNVQLKQNALLDKDYIDYIDEKKNKNIFF